MSKVKGQYQVRLIFDNKKAAEKFVGYWIDGGVGCGGNLDWDWDHKDSQLPSRLRITGTGEQYEDDQEDTSLTKDAKRQKTSAPLSKKTLTALDASMKNLSEGRAGSPVDLDAFNPEDGDNDTT